MFVYYLLNDKVKRKKKEAGLKSRKSKVSVKFEVRSDLVAGIEAPAN